MYVPSKKYGLVKSKHYRKWLEKNLPIVEEKLPVIKNFPVEIEITVMEGYGFHNSSDIDNCNKAIVDSLKKTGRIPDDNIKYITRCEEKFMPFWSKRSEAITMVCVIEPDTDHTSYYDTLEDS